MHEPSIVLNQVFCVKHMLHASRLLSCMLNHMLNWIKTVVVFCVHALLRKANIIFTHYFLVVFA